MKIIRTMDSFSFWTRNCIVQLNFVVLLRFHHQIYYAFLRYFTASWIAHRETKIKRQQWELDESHQRTKNVQQVWSIGLGAVRFILNIKHRTLNMLWTVDTFYVFIYTVNSKTQIQNFLRTEIWIGFFKIHQSIESNPSECCSTVEFTNLTTLMRFYSFENDLKRNTFAY